MQTERGEMYAEGRDWQVPRREKDPLKGIVPERGHREQVQSEVAAAMNKFQLSEIQTKRGLDRRMDEITNELIKATDDKERHRLAVERVALIKYRQELLRQEAYVPVPRDVHSAPDALVSEQPAPAEGTFVGEAPSVEDAPEVPGRFREQQKKNVIQHDEVLKMKSLEEELREKQAKRRVGRSTAGVPEDTVPGVDLRKRVQPPSETFIQELPVQRQEAA